MKIKSRETDGVVILDLSGDMYGGPDSMALVDALTALAAEKKLNAILNLEKVRHVPSPGLGILVVARSRYAKEGGALKLLKPNERVLGVLTLTQLILLFEVFTTEREAIESFRR